MERRWALRPPKHSLGMRLGTNAAVSALAFGASALLVQPLVKLLLNMTAEQKFGLLQLGNGPWLAEALLTFLLLDLSFYYWHRLNHRVLLLWRFHNVHHIDPDLDVSTGFRFHPGEIALSTGFRAVQLCIIGPNIWAFLIYEGIFQASTLFHHSNIRLPRKLERALNFIFVTPRMHGLHHSVLKEETNSNYSVVFSFWDRFHKTLTPLESPQKNVGVPGYSKAQDNSLWALLKTPFQKQRPYW